MSDAAKEVVGETISRRSAGKMRGDECGEVSITIGPSVNSCALIEEAFGTDSGDGLLTLTSMLVVRCLPRRKAGGHSCPCVWEVEDGRAVGLWGLIVGLTLPSAWSRVSTTRCGGWVVRGEGIGEGDLDDRPLNRDGAGPGPNWR